MSFNESVAAAVYYDESVAAATVDAAAVYYYESVAAATIDAAAVSPA